MEINKNGLLEWRRTRNTNWRPRRWGRKEGENIPFSSLPALPSFSFREARKCRKIYEREMERRRGRKLQRRIEEKQRDLQSQQRRLRKGAVLEERGGGGGGLMRQLGQLFCAAFFSLFERSSYANPPFSLFRGERDANLDLSGDPCPLLFFASLPSWNSKSFAHSLPNEVQVLESIVRPPSDHQIAIVFIPDRALMQTFPLSALSRQLLSMFLDYFFVTAFFPVPFSQFCCCRKYFTNE